LQATYQVNKICTYDDQFLVMFTENTFSAATFTLQFRMLFILYFSPPPPLPLSLWPFFQADLG